MDFDKTFQFEATLINLLSEDSELGTEMWVRDKEGSRKRTFVDARAATRSAGLPAGCRCIDACPRRRLSMTIADDPFLNLTRGKMQFMELFIIPAYYHMWFSHNVSAT